MREPADQRRYSRVGFVVDRLVRIRRIVGGLKEEAAARGTTTNVQIRNVTVNRLTVLNPHPFHALPPPHRPLLQPPLLLPSHEASWDPRPERRSTGSSYRAAMEAATAACEGAGMAARGEGTPLVACRPPGHHACGDRSMGGCLVNSVCRGGVLCAGGGGGGGEGWGFWTWTITLWERDRETAGRRRGRSGM